MSIFKGQIELPKEIGRFGYTRKNSNGSKKRHGGVDITCPDAPPDNTPVYAVEDANVIWSKKAASGKTAEWGEYVTYQGTKSKLFFTNAHLASRSVVQGQKIKAGEQIGVMGNTGNAAGGYKHVHFEARKTLSGTGIDPTPYLGIKNAVGIYGTKPEDDMKYRLYQVDTAYMTKETAISEYTRRIKAGERVGFDRASSDGRLRLGHSIRASENALDLVPYLAENTFIG